MLLLASLLSVLFLDLDTSLYILDLDFDDLSPDALPSPSPSCN